MTTCMMICSPSEYVLWFVWNHWTITAPLIYELIKVVDKVPKEYPSGHLDTDWVFLRKTSGAYVLTAAYDTYVNSIDFGRWIERCQLKMMVNSLSKAMWKKTENNRSKMYQLSDGRKFVNDDKDNIDVVSAEQQQRRKEISVCRSSATHIAL